ncbi:hypothetical protein AYI68_g7713 [Smittium mucronatum]|uniref:Retrotransposon gag domain-containing protein n=1 Tax=Smittium mucronatum TaxID=133383 RepID=A0A1R0GMW9_9FUNG|nr:hypothetical protein AYI68_g7713 [Smittium mucronatum]
MQYQEEKLQIVSIEKDLTLREADFYRRRSKKQQNPELLQIHTLVPPLPFEIFLNSMLTELNQCMIVVDSLKREVRSWYNAEPDSSTTTWPALKDALLLQYGGTNYISNTLTTVASMKLNARSEFSTFVQRIQLSIQLIAMGENSLAVAIIRHQIDSDIRQYPPEIRDELLSYFDQLLRLQLQEMQSKPSSIVSFQSSNNNNAIDFDTISAIIRRQPQFSRTAISFSTRSRSPDGFRQRYTLPSSPENTTIVRTQFEEYVKNSICFTCARKDTFEQCVHVETKNTLF